MSSKTTYFIEDVKRVRVGEIAWVGWIDSSWFDGELFKLCVCIYPHDDESYGVWKIVDILGNLPEAYDYEISTRDTIIKRVTKPTKTVYENIVKEKL